MITRGASYKVATTWAVVGTMIGIGALLFHYNMVSLSLPGYELLVAPAMFAMSFFSKETEFTAKMIIFLFGQFIGYFFCFYWYKIFKWKTRLPRS